MTLRTKIIRVGQGFVDQPVHVQPKPQTQVEVSVAVAFGTHRLRKPITTRHVRRYLDWVKPEKT